MIEDSIRTKLAATTAVTDLVASRIHLDKMHDSDDNYIVITVINNKTPLTVQLEDQQGEARLQIDCYSTTPVTAKAIAKAVNACLNKQGFSDDDSDVQICTRESQIPSSEPDTQRYRQTIDYIIHYDEV